MPKNKYIETPEKLLQLFKDYATHTKSNPRKRKVKGNKDFVISDEELEVPLTMEGFRTYCFEKIGCVKHYFDNTDNRYSEYSTICLYIKDLIRQDQIEGGMVGQYTPSITQRLNNLTEKTDITTGGEKIESKTIVDLSKLDTETLKKLLPENDKPVNE